MIRDNIQNAHRYDDMHKYFRIIFEILQSLNYEALQDGYIELDGKYAFIDIKTVNGVNQKEAKLKSHRRYIDIQMPLTGIETIGLKQTKDCTNIFAKYDEECDTELYSDIPDNYETLNPGDFIILFPEDAHVSCITPSIAHQKLVVKVSIIPNAERPTL